jgi:hypothetical protein
LSTESASRIEPEKFDRKRKEEYLNSRGIGLVTNRARKALDPEPGIDQL